jgi:hypothetical protein
LACFLFLLFLLLFFLGVFFFYLDIFFLFFLVGGLVCGWFVYRPVRLFCR